MKRFFSFVQLKTLLLAVFLLFSLLPDNAQAIRIEIDEDTLIYNLRQCESLVVVNVLSRKKVDGVLYGDSSPLWIEDLGDLYEIKVRVLRTIHGEKVPAKTYTLRGFFEYPAISKRMILELRKPTAKEIENNRVCVIIEDIYYEDFGEYVIGWHKFARQNGKYIGYDGNFASEKELIKKLKEEEAT